MTKSVKWPIGKKRSVLSEFKLGNHFYATAYIGGKKNMTDILHCLLVKKKVSECLSHGSCDFKNTCVPSSDTPH